MSNREDKRCLEAEAETLRDKIKRHDSIVDQLIKELEEVENLLEKIENKGSWRVEE